MHIRRLYPILPILALLLQGCASHQYLYKPDELTAVLANRLEPDEASRIEIPYACSPDMVEYARKVVGSEINPIKKSVRLVEAITSEWKLDVTYERTADATADKVFHETKRANCLSFTHLFVSLARAVGIKAHYVDVRHDDLFLNENVLVSSRHICAGVHDGADFFLIDFDPDPRKTYRIYQKIDDIEAVANHYNNIAINQFGANPDTLQEAIHYLDIALRIKPDFSRALNNRGALVFILGRPEEAEKLIRRALIHDPKMPEAYSNLSGILLENGDIDTALQFARTAVQLRPNSSQYRLRLAQALLITYDYAEAYKEFRWVTRRDAKNYKALHGLAVSAYHLGKFDIAESTIRKARAVNPQSRDFTYLESLIHLKRSKSN